MNCKDCKFGKVVEMEAKQGPEGVFEKIEMIQCRRNPPQLLSNGQAASFPYLFQDGWCGEFAEKEVLDAKD